MVTHKPRNLKIEMELAASNELNPIKMIFTVAFKLSATKIKRRENKVTDNFISIYLFPETIQDSTGKIPGKKFNRRKHRSLIGTKNIFTDIDQSLPYQQPYIKIHPLTPPDNGPFLYVVETKGGGTIGRIKQKYALFQLLGVYEIDCSSLLLYDSFKILQVYAEDHEGTYPVNHWENYLYSKLSLLGMPSLSSPSTSDDDDEEKRIQFPERLDL
jgi:hypothetical protein